MCQQCTCQALTYGEAVPDWYLMQAQVDGSTWKAGQWGLVWSNDPTFTWTGTPTPNPAFGLDDAAEEALWKANEHNEIGARIVSTELPESFKEAFDTMNPRTGYDLVVASMQRGYDPDTSGDLAWWLWDWFGEYLRTATPRHHGAVD